MISFVKYYYVFVHLKKIICILFLKIIYILRIFSPQKIILVANFWCSSQTNSYISLDIREKEGEEWKLRKQQKMIRRELSLYHNNQKT